MNIRNIRRILLFAFLVLIVISIINVLAAVNIVPRSLIANSLTALTINSIKPAECVALNLTNIINCVGAGNCNGTSGNDLILGNTENNKIRGGDGDDCLVGGAGADDLDGQSGYDVCIGGPGIDKLGGHCDVQIQ